MNFNHTPERQMLADTLNRFVLDKYDIDTRNRSVELANGFSPQIWSELCDLGIPGALFSDQCGGFGGDAFDITVLFEVVGRSLLVEPLLENVVLAGGAIAESGDDQHKHRLEKIINGAQVAGFAHYEPESRYETTLVSTTAKPLANSQANPQANLQTNQWVLNGVKSVVRHAGCADFFVVSARTSGQHNDSAGVSLFLVPADAYGLRLQTYRTFDGARAAELTLTDVTLESDALIGEQDHGITVLEKAIGRGVLALCAESLGAMDVAKEFTIEFLKSRQQFGVPLGKFQALQHRMADLFIEIEQARSAVINAAAALNKDRVTRERALSTAKYTTGRVGRLVAEEAIQLHGGMGMTWELPLGHYAKRLIGIDHELGDADHHLGRFMALSRET